MSMENFKNPWAKGGEYYPDWLGGEKALGGMEENSIKAQNNKTFPAPSIVFSNYINDRFTNEINECAVRLSVAMIESGVDISGSSKFRPLIKANNGSMVQPSAAALADWIYVVLGRPKIYIHQSAQWQKSDFITKEGLIYFAHPESPNRGGDGPGHIDVISGGHIGSGFYPNKKIWFWEYGIDAYIKN